jgi:hypothetical protein
VNRKGRETCSFDLRHCDGNAKTRKAHIIRFNSSPVMPADRHFHAYHDFWEWGGGGKWQLIHSYTTGNNALVANFVAERFGDEINAYSRVCGSI